MFASALFVKFLRRKYSSTEDWDCTSSCAQFQARLELTLRGFGGDDGKVLFVRLDQIQTKVEIP
jgi:hypothetical protein